MTVFDAHAHCFPPLGDDGGIKRMRLAEHQYHVRFHKQGIRRSRDGAKIDATLLAGEADGVSYQPDVDFRIGEFAGAIAKSLAWIHQNHTKVYKITVADNCL